MKAQGSSSDSSPRFSDHYSIFRVPSASPSSSFSDHICYSDYYEAKNLSRLLEEFHGGTKNYIIDNYLDELRTPHVTKRTVKVKDKQDCLNASHEGKKLNQEELDICQLYTHGPPQGSYSKNHKRSDYDIDEQRKRGDEPPLVNNQKKKTSIDQEMTKVMKQDSEPSASNVLPTIFPDIGVGNNNNSNKKADNNKGTHKAAISRLLDDCSSCECQCLSKSDLNWKICFHKLNSIATVLDAILTKLRQNDNCNTKCYESIEKEIECPAVVKSIHQIKFIRNPLACEMDIKFIGKTPSELGFPLIESYASIFNLSDFNLALISKAYAFPFDRYETLRTLRDFKNYKMSPHDRKRLVEEIGMLYGFLC